MNKISKETIVNALDLLIENKEFREDLAFNGKQKVSELTWENYSIMLNSIIKTILFFYKNIIIDHQIISII